MLSPYSVKKLIGMNLVTGTKRGKEVFPNATQEGVVLRTLSRGQGILLAARVFGTGRGTHVWRSSPIAANVSGRYDQAARAASSY